MDKYLLREVVNSSVLAGGCSFSWLGPPLLVEAYCWKGPAQGQRDKLLRKRIKDPCSSSGEVLVRVRIFDSWNGIYIYMYICVYIYIYKYINGTYTLWPAIEYPILQPVHPTVVIERSSLEVPLPSGTGGASHWCWAERSPRLGGNRASRGVTTSRARKSLRQ